MKIRQLILPVAALIGAGIAVVVVMRGDRSAPSSATPAAGNRGSGQPAAATMPFESYIAGTGVVEAGSGNIAVGTPVSGIITEVFVTWGAAVKPGDPLFRIDARELHAKLPPAAARAREAEATLAKARYERELAARVHEQHLLSDEQFRSRQFEVQINEAAVSAARAEIEQINIEIGRRIVRAAMSGRVLQINARPGEFAESGALPTPLMVIGDDVRLRVRVDIDEHDALRVEPTAPAIAVVRGSPEFNTALHFESIEPYVVPKRSLTGDVTERVDTRVLQVIYSFDRSALPVYVGQYLDVDIRATTPEK